MGMFVFTDDALCIMPTNCLPVVSPVFFVTDIVKLMVHELKLPFLGTYQ
jgi:hypothetical protein